MSASMDSSMRARGGGVTFYLESCNLLGASSQGFV